MAFRGWRFVVCAVGGLRGWWFARLAVCAVGGLRGWRFARLAVCVVGGLRGWRCARLAFCAAGAVGGLRGWRYARLAVCAVGGLRNQPPRHSHVQELLAGEAPVVAASDYQKALVEPLRGGLSAPMIALGTDGFGRSDTRASLRGFFEVDRRFVALAALSALARTQQVSLDAVARARDDFGIDPEKPNPRLS